MLKVLIVEDEPQLLHNLASFLSSFDGEFEVISALSGEEGLAVLSYDDRIDVLLTDLRLPGIDGIDVVRATVENYPHISVLVMTAFGSGDLRRLATSAGALKFIEKPIDLDELAVTLYETHQRRKGSSHEVAGLEVIDVAKFMAVDAATKVILFRAGLKEGSIRFERGEIVHCSTRHHEGSDAFHAMALWGEGSFREEFDPDLAALPNNVNIPTVELLEEAARLIDVTRTGEPATGESPTPPPGHKQPDGKEIDRMAINDLLGEFESIEGFQGAAVFTAQGEMLDGVAKGKVDIKTIGMFANNALLNAQKATDQMGVGRGNLMQIRAPQAIVLMRCLNEATDFAATKEGKAHFHTVIVLDPEGNVGMASMILDKIVAKVAEELR